jgi:hypothetical protein
VTRYGLFGAQSRDFLTYGGRVLVHDNPDELAFLIEGATVRAVPPSIPDALTLPITAHPELTGVRFPLSRRDFR